LLNPVRTPFQADLEIRSPSRPYPRGEGVMDLSFYANQDTFSDMVFCKIVSESKHLHGADLNTKSKSKVLRKSMTPAELRLWKRLRGNKIEGFHFRRQHPYGIYILGFFCSRANLAIEADGDIHDFKKEYDSERTKYLEESGIRVIRFTNS
jgi:5-methyltetrahydrofolate--homocysteine methyltransferase/ATP-dependent helicase HrpA